MHWRLARRAVGHLNRNKAAMNPGLQLQASEEPAS